MSNQTMVKLAASETKSERKTPMSILSGTDLRAMRAREIRRIIGKIGRHLSRPPRVAFAGEFNTGKSTLVNALLGGSIVSHSVLTNSRLPILIHYSAIPVLHVEFEGGRREAMTWSKADNFDMTGAQLLSLGLPIERLKTFEIIDTPGIGAGRADVDRRALAACRHSHVAVWCTSALQAWKRTEANLWHELPQRLRANSILAVTYKDALQSERDAARLRARIVAEAAGQFRTYVLVAGTEAMEARGHNTHGETESLWQSSGGAGLAAAINAAVSSVLVRRLANAERLLSQVAADLAPKALMQRH